MKIHRLCVKMPAKGVEFQGGSLHDGFGSLTVLVVLASTFPSFCLSFKIQHKVATVTVLAVAAVLVASVVTATPLFRHPVCKCFLTD